MKFMMMMKADCAYEQGAMPAPELEAAMATFTESKMKAGIVLEVGGLLPSGAGALVRAEGGGLTVIDGPFAESKELIGGYAIVQADSKEAAIAEAKEFMSLHLRVLGPDYTGECQIRQMWE